MSANQDNYLHRIFDYERKILLFSGVYPNKGRMKLLHFISTFLHLSMAIFSIISMLIYIIKNSKDESVPQTLAVCITLLSSLLKLLNFLSQQKKLLEVESVLSGQIFYELNKKYVNFEKYIRPTLRICSLFTAVAYSSVTCFAIFPLLNKEQYSLLFPAWYPYKINTSFKYTVTFVFQYISTGVYVNVAMDTFTYKLIIIASYQYEVLKNNLSNIAYETKEAKKEFAKNVVLHYQILKLLAMIQDIFSYGIFVQLCFSVGVICFTEFQMLIVSPASSTFIIMVLYFCAMLLQVFLYCWFGHNIIFTSENINDAIYMSNWYEADITLKKSIIIFMEKCKNNEVLTAGNLFPLSLQTFSSIMRSSYSYAAVLQTMYNTK